MGVGGAAPTTRATRVLLVEDAEDDAALIQRTLERAGMVLEMRRVDSAPALQAALGEPWDLVLSDFEMPGFDGLEAFDLVHARYPDVPFIFVSGALGEERAVAAMRKGASDYLLKTHLHRLDVTVQRELRASRERAARRRADEATARHQRRLEMAITASGLGVFEQTGDGAYLTERWCELLAIPEGTLEETRFPAWLIERLHPDDVLPFQSAYAGFQAGRSDRLRGEFRLRCPEGQWLFVLITMTYPAPGHMVGVLEDLTMRHRLEAQLRQAQKMEAVGRLAGGVAHDFNNLLTAILGFGEIMAMDDNLSPTQRTDLEDVVGAARKAEALTGQLLAFSRRRTIAPRVLNPNEVIDDARRLLTRLLGPRMELAFHLGTGLGAIRIDTVAFEQVLINLVVNARDAMPAGGRITLATRNVKLAPDHDEVLAGRLESGPHVEVTVTDTGTGMAPEVLGHLFEPFFTTKEAGKGTGLGLSTCYGIVQQAKGSIAVESELGVGTSFRLHFPLVAEPVEARAERPASAAHLPKGEVVLLVEDDPLVARLLERALSRLGFEVRHASDGPSALEIERHSEGPIHLLLTDVFLPGMDGVAMAHTFSERRPSVPVIFMTGDSDHGELVSNAQVLSKPFTLEALAQEVHAALARASLSPTKT